MADAKPVGVGVASDSGKPRNTRRPVRAGLIQEKEFEDDPDEGTLDPADEFKDEEVEV
jgi:hypothetical protein